MKITEVLQYSQQQFPESIDIQDLTGVNQEIKDFVFTENILENLNKIIDYYNSTYAVQNSFWIEGEFGVGKSYFLKILSILLESKDQGRDPSSSILSKVGDDELVQELKSGLQHASETVRISLAKELSSAASLLEIFYNHLNKHIDFSKNFTNEERERQINRSAITKKVNRSIKELIDLVKNYLEKNENGFRLNLFIDSVEILTEKLTFDFFCIIEKLSTETCGQVSIFLASTTIPQESELNKIKGKIDFHCYVSSLEDDKILQHKLLAKNEKQIEILTPLFEPFSKIFSPPIAHYFDSDPFSFKLFSDYYPFLPYQIPLYKDCKVSLHANIPSVFEYQPKYNSFAARETLRVFNNILQKVSKRPVHKIVSYDYFFEELTHLKEESFIKKYIKNNECKFPLETRILKVLFMTQFSTRFQSTIENIASLLIDDLQVDWKIHYKAVEDSLYQLGEKKVVTNNLDRYFYSL